METPASRTRQQPQPVARFNTFEEAETEIKAQIQSASRTQRALRTRTNVNHIKVTPDETDGLEPAPVAIRKSKILDCPARPESVNALGDSERHSLDRTFSFNSLSTLQRGVEAARLSQWRDSPVSAFSPTDRTACSNGDQTLDPQETYPPLTVYKLKQLRKDEKEQRKSLKKQEKVQKKADKAAAHRRRHSVALDPAVLGIQGDTIDTLSDGSSVPRRAISDPSFKASRDAAVQLVKRLTAKPINRLSRRVKAPQQPIPHVDDFMSKPELLEYLNSELPEANLPIAELPGPLPPYTPFQNSMANADNSIVHADILAGSQSLRRAQSAHGGLQREGSGRQMRCDNCQFGIKLDDYFLQCSICDNGDRIICIGCDSAGESCRHELTRRRRQALGYSDPTEQTGPSRMNPRRRYDTPPRAATFTTAEEMQRHPNLSHNEHHADGQPSHRSKTVMTELQERKHLLDQRDLEIQRREQDLLFREKESMLRERETTLQQRHSRLREREMDLEAKSRQHQRNLQTQDDFARQCSGMATFLGSQFASLQAQMSQMSISASLSTSPPGANGEIDFSDEANFRTHAGKRKASGKARTESSNSTARPTRPSLKPISRGDLDSPDEDDEEGNYGTPKKMKQDPDDSTSPGKLYACHYCKYDSSRYSERNNSEKHYRGCSSGYWPDISRLKQHLYRVHWRNHHCERCFTVFKKSSDLQAHMRMLTCQPTSCPYPEKFENDKYNEIRKKRPANTPEDVWYIIHGILFPGEPQPASPYADSADAQRTSSSSPRLPAPQTWDALGSAFECRLDQHQDSPTQAWLRMPEVRDFIREQLRASMADVLQQITPAPTPATTPMSGERSPRSAIGRDSRRLSIPGLGSSVPASPVPLSASSTRSASSVQWRLPNHRRSFSRPLLPQGLGDSLEGHPDRPILSLNTAKTLSGVTFAVTTPDDPEDDQYDDECGSWHQNDDSLGLAITTDTFDFDFSQSESMELMPKQLGHVTQAAQNPVSSRQPERTFEFRPVKVSSLDEAATDGKSTSTTLPIIDSAYGSLESNHGSSNPRPNRHHVKSTANSQLPTIPQAMDLDMPVPEHELDMDALKIPFQDFLGADMDECGNIGGRSLTEYLYGQSVSG